MRGTVNTEVAAAYRPEALAFLEQAEDFYRAATASVSANPLLLYYAFMSLGKAIIRVRGYPGSLDQAMHGLKEETVPGGSELKDSVVIAKDSGTVTNVYPELIERLGAPRPATNDRYPVPELLSQVVVGHRIWREASASHKERFIDLKHIDLIENRAARRVWLRLFVSKGDLSRYGVTRARLLRESALTPAFHEVNAAATGRGRELVCLEQRTSVQYTGRATDVVADLVRDIRHNLWRIVSAVPGSTYRRYYLYLGPATEIRLPQLASLWTIFFYLGSVVRYRPHLFDELLKSDYGAFIAEFVSSQPEQMVYLLASELCQREIARPAIV
jgi:hypothetical protein